MKARITLAAALTALALFSAFMTTAGIDSINIATYQQ